MSPRMADDCSITQSNTNIEAHSGKPLSIKVLLYKPPPAFRPKNRLFLRNWGRWFRISTSFAPQTASFGDIHISSNKSDINFRI